MAPEFDFAIGKIDVTVVTDEFEVRIYQEHPDGDPEMLLGISGLSYFGGTCPNVGDIFATWTQGTPYGYFLVEKRYFIEQQDGPRGWAIFVRELKPTPSDQRMVAQWAKDTEFFSREPDNRTVAHEEPTPPTLPKSKRISRKAKGAKPPATRS
ncbi:MULTISPECIES: hypothetical protein [unclassified Rhizobium]|uniref:hypothetical protein n=1 Tax=unclassified Rhizobium TaxID=2613769 RepID=UPI000BE91C23|nr:MULTISPECIES: hypothetical protein [unclassified Rhizobium]MDF0659735.1 hypothetical protein [Rhizobium sp. BC49]PDS85249.1 hypothetical protein CO654_12290 [Rhizobium sp. L18]